MIFGTKHAIIRYAFRSSNIARSVFLLLKDQTALWPITLLESSIPSNDPRTNWTIFFWQSAIDRPKNSVKTANRAGVAQLVEHPICNRAVGSSSLSASTISPSHHVLTH
jgi:hypothetical protein